MIIREERRVKKGPLLLALVIFLTMIPAGPVRAEPEEPEPVEATEPEGNSEVKKEVTISFKDKELTYILGENNNIVSDCKISEAADFKEGDITYYMLGGIGLDIDETTGQVSVSDISSLERSVRIMGGDMRVNVYAKVSNPEISSLAGCSYSIIIKHASLTEDPPFLIRGNLAEDNNPGKWYSSDVEVLPCDPDKYESAFGSPEDFKPSVIITSEGTTKDYAYLRNKETGGISSRRELSVNIDKSAPQTNYYYNYYSGKFELTVYESNFDPALLEADVKAEDIAGNPLSPPDITAMLSGAKWTHVGNMHKCTLDGLPDGIYDLTIKCRDRAGNENTGKTCSFIRDTVKPDKPEISYETPLSEKVLNAVTFGFYKPSMEVTFTSRDETSGVKYFEWTYMDLPGESSGGGGLHGTVHAVRDEEDKTKYFAKIRLPLESGDQLKGYISVKAMDGYEIADPGYKANTSQVHTDSTRVVVVDSLSPRLSVTYLAPEGNDGEASYYGRGSGGRFTVQFDLREANFYPENLNASIIKDDGKPEKIDLSWTGAGDDHRAEYTVTGNGKYVITLDYTDPSGNKMNHYESGVKIIDADSPEMEIYFESAAGGKAVKEENGILYFDGKVTGRITLKEKYFDEKNLRLLLSGSGVETSLMVNWDAGTGDKHTGTFSISGDGEYRVNVAYTDRAGNDAQSYSSPKINVDTIPPEIEVLTNEVISFILRDHNYDSSSIRIIHKGLHTDQDVTGRYINTRSGDKEITGSFIIPTEAENDGIYILSLEMTDKAGHLTKKDTRFVINRYGSVYEYDDYLSGLIKDGGKIIRKIAGEESAVTRDLVIREYNSAGLASGSLSIQITRDGETIETISSAVCSESGEGPSGGWQQWTYSLSPDNFIEDGEYVITISSRDNTGKEAVTDRISFTVDNTPPELVRISNLEKKIVDSDHLMVEYNVRDMGGLSRIMVMVDNSTLQEISDFGGDINDYEGEFVLDSVDGKQRVRIIAEDLAGNITDTDSREFSTGDKYVFNPEITVSTSPLVRWMADKPVFYGSIGGAGGALLLALYMILKRA